MLSAAFLLAVDLILPHPKRPQNMISLERTYYVYSYKVQLVYMQVILILHEVARLCYHYTYKYTTVY